MSSVTAQQTTLASFVRTRNLPAFLILAATMEPVLKKTTTSLVHVLLALEGHYVKISPHIVSMALRL